MGQLIGQYIEISNPETREVLEEPKNLKQEQFIWFKYGLGDSTYYDTKKKTLAKLVDDRNELIHHLLPQFDPNSIESCAQIEKKLDEQRDNIVRQIDDLKLEIDGLLFYKLVFLRIIYKLLVLTPLHLIVFHNHHIDLLLHFRFDNVGICLQYIYLVDIFGNFHNKLLQCFF